MHCRYVTLCMAGLLAIALGSTSLADHELDFDDFADGAADPLRIQLYHPQDGALRAPHVPAVSFTLPETRIPDDVLRRRQLQAADMNGDGVVDSEDLAIMLGHFGPCADQFPCRGDLNRDGVIDDADVLLLLRLFGESASTGYHNRAQQVGYVREAPEPVRRVLPRHQLDDGRVVSRVELTSPDAAGLRVQIDGMRTPGLAVRVYDPAGEAVLGPYFANRSDDDGRWYTPAIYGESIGIEIIYDRPNLDAGAPTIARIAYIFGDDNCETCAGCPLDCHNCIACHPSWQDADARAVGQVTFVSFFSVSRCSGALLSRQPNEQYRPPLFMIANHCISTQAQANSVDIRWLYEGSNCAGCSGVPHCNAVPQNNGTLMLKRRSDSDWTLLGLYDPPNVPDSVYYLGWDASHWGLNNSATDIHHARGSHKRITFGDSGALNYVSFDDGTWSAHVQRVNYSSGTTEPASSGAPILDSNRRVRGTLSGGPKPECAPTLGWYGRFRRAYRNLRFFMGDDHIPVGTVFVDGAVAGDPGNNGNWERGTSSRPFNTVHEATFCVREGDEVAVKPGSYPEFMTIWRPMTITRNGDSGIVRIGTP